MLSISVYPKENTSKVRTCKDSGLILVVCLCMLCTVYILRRGVLQRSGLIVKYGLTSIHTIHTFLPCASSHPSLIRASPHPTLYLGCACPFPTSLTLHYDDYITVFERLTRMARGRPHKY